MALSTVNVSIKGLFQNEQPFTGFIVFKLSRIVFAEDGTVVFPKEGHRVPFRSDGESVAKLVPNSLLGDGTYYEYEIIRKTPSGLVSRQDTVLSNTCIVPNYDCNLVDISDLATDPSEDLPTAQLYASQAKAALAELKNIPVTAVSEDEFSRLPEGGLLFL